MKKPRRYPSAYPFISWERPTSEQAAEGILAIMIEAHSLPLTDGTRRYYEQRTPYRHDSLLRRYKRCKDIPPFISVVTATEDV